ncbi:CBL-interacting protein kinase 24 [Camellia lanceoleosa]|uniref:CBL-interacting protein kinase 24 n=1 Tax=Camellia lanceoleosa TaxID=1840588 RepID=A0ACC0GWR9_9ERIC|nr:CBL-interacting protein kinase 24 [Camellia lanceoleosa]
MGSSMVSFVFLDILRGMKTEFTIYIKRIRIEGIKNDPWFRKNYVAVEHGGDEDVNLDNVHTVFDDIEEQHVTEQSENNDSGPFIMNAFEMITLSQGLNLSFCSTKRQTRLEGMSVNKIGQFLCCLGGFFLFMVDVRKATGDTNEYHKFYKNFCAKLEHIIWKPKDGPAKSSA